MVSPTASMVSAASSRQGVRVDLSKYFSATAGTSSQATEAEEPRPGTSKEAHRISDPGFDEADPAVLQIVTQTETEEETPAEEDAPVVVKVSETLGELVDIPSLFIPCAFQASDLPDDRSANLRELHNQLPAKVDDIPDMKANRLQFQMRLIDLRPYVSTSPKN